MNGNSVLHNTLCANYFVYLCWCQFHDADRHKVLACECMLQCVFNFG